MAGNHTSQRPFSNRRRSLPFYLLSHYDRQRGNSVWMTVRPLDASTFGPGLAVIRRRRRYFFATVAIYMPAMWVVHSISPAYRTMGTAIGIWVVILAVTMFRSALCVPKSERK